MDIIQSIGPQVVCSAFIEKDGKYLIFLCPRFRVWRVPGGRAEINEKIEETIKREMKEEIGLEIENPKFIGYGQDHQFHFIKNQETSRLLMFFHVKISKEPIVDRNEADEIKWVTLEELKMINNIEDGLKELFRKYPSLSLK